MTNRTSLFVGLLTLGVGFFAGTTHESWTFPSAVRANALDPERVESLYRDLDVGESALISGSERLAKIAEVNTPSVVRIQSEHDDDSGRRVEETGSGVIISSTKAPGRFVVTNYHVVSGARLDDIWIHLDDGRIIQPTRIWSDKPTDIAVLRVSARGLQVARWGDSDEAKIGHLVLAMGSPFGLSHSVTLGIISAKGRRSLQLGVGGNGVINQDFIQTDAAINPGNSGGPLINLSGQVIGINAAIASNSGGNEGIGFSIPSNLVQHIVDQLLEHNRIRRAYLGVKLDSNLTLETARRLKLDRVRGARIVEVYPNTPAAGAGLRYDDVILQIDGVAVADENHLINLVSLSKVGKRTRLLLTRHGRSMTVEVMLSTRPEPQ